MKQIYDSEKKKYIQCEVLIFDEEEGLPEGTGRREILLYCADEDETIFSEFNDEFAADLDDLYPETKLIDQYEDFDNRQGQ